MHQINKIKDRAVHVQSFAEAECVLIGLPLYTDAMPGVVKDFIDSLASLRDRADNPPVGFLVQSGFPESGHSRYVERYLQKLATRLGSPYLGTIVKGGIEGIQIMPHRMTHKVYSTLTEIGIAFGEQGVIDPQLLRKLARPEYRSRISAPFFKLLTRLPGSSFYWDNQLKQNGVYEKRFAQPYAEELPDTP
jgi:hypothetical protein